MSNVYKPANIYIVEDELNREFEGTAITFYNMGTWLVEIDGILILPNGSLNEALNGKDIRHNYQILFKEDLSSHPVTTNNPALKNGKFVICRMMIKN